MLKKTVQRGRSERRGDAYSVPYGEPLNEATTKLADFFSILLVLLDSLAPSSMATQAVRKAPRSMDTLRFLAKVSDQVIIDRLGAQAAAFSDSMTIPARCRSRRSKDQIAMGIQHMDILVLVLGLSPDTLVNRRDRRDLNRDLDAAQ